MKILEPLVIYIGKLSFSNKLRVTALTFGLPLLLIAGALFYSLQAQVSALKTEKAALTLQVPAFSLIVDLHQYAAIRLAHDEGAEAAGQLIDKQQSQVKQSLGTLSKVFEETGLSTALKDKRTKWLGQWQALGKQIDGASPQDTAELAIALRNEMEKLNEVAGLLIDADATNSRLLDIITTHIPGLIETNGRAAQIGSVVLVKKSIRGTKRNELTVQRGNFDALVQWSMDGMQKVATENPASARKLEDASQTLNAAFLGIQEAMTTKMLDTMDYDMAPEAFLGLTAKAFADTMTVARNIADEADAMLTTRLDTLSLQRNALAALLLVGFALIVLGFIAAYTSIMRGLDGLSDAVDTMAAGDLDARAEVHSKDEIGKLAVQFNTMAESLALRTEQLNEKTQDIQGMLQNMPQGILTIVADGTIHPEYSAYLETIFEIKDVAGKPAMAFLFAAANVGTDALSQVEATLGACIGEDAMNFDFNAHLLVNEISRAFPDGRKKILDLSWSTICDENDIVEKIMVCVRDVTELRELEAEAEHQKRELDMIGQILKISQEKFHDFIDSAQGFIRANAKLLKEAEDKNLDLVTQLFRNMHTIKGNARTYGFLHLTNIVHEAEQAYDELRKNPDAIFDKEVLLLQLGEVAELIYEYASLNDVTLGRKGPGRRGSAEKYAMVPRARVDELLGILNAYDLQATRQETLAALLRQVMLDLRLIGTEPVHSILDGVFESLPSLARELGKEAPQLLVHDHGIHIRNQISDLLRNAFMHLYRNAMDHGIEKPDERIAKGKPAAGTIQMDLSQNGGMLEMRLKDDGKGLALGHIRRKGLDKGTLTPELAHNDAEVAKLIFAAGFSTATAVTEVSGRGVGMDAVQDFIRREGGSIRIELTDNRQGEDFRSFQTIIALPGKFAVDGTPDSAFAEIHTLHTSSTELRKASASLWGVAAQPA